MVVAGLVAALIVAGSWANQRLEADEGSVPGDRLLYLPSGRLLQILDLGHSELLADLIYLWSIQFYGNYPGGVRYDYLVQIYDRVITELDPRFRDAYILGALILSMEARRPEAALTLLDKGIRALPDDWLLPFEAGFIAYHDLRDYARAAEYFRTAIERPGVPPPVRRFHAEMFNRMGDRRTSRRHWQEILATAESDYVRSIAQRHVHDLSVEIDLAVLREAIERYRSLEGEPPSDLRTLVHVGIAEAIPLDPDGNPYAYDPETGEVSPRTRFAFPGAGGRR